MRRGLGRLLRALGWDCTAFESAEQFLGQCGGEAAGLVLIDIHLPGMSGVDLLMRLRESGSDRGAVLMTAHGEAETRELLAKAEGVTCLRKPFGREELISAIL